MTVLEWDKVGDRRFETGVDRGVLYLPDGSAVPWNGLTQVNEKTSREIKSYYIDGIKYLDHFVPGVYSGKLSAFTYPDELEPLLGKAEFVPGVVVHDQPTQVFSLAYRTQVGNDIEGVDYGYKLHILYNVQANPSDTTFSSMSDSISPNMFEWDLTGTPPTMFGVRPTSHISLDSMRIDPDLLGLIEALLYGTVGTEAALPTAVDLLAMAEGA